MDLTTTYLGLSLRNPLVASASPLSRTVTGVQRLAEAGVGAVVLPSLFEEQLRRFFSSTGDIAMRLDEVGADGLVLFNRFMQTDVDPETLAITATMPLSHPVEARLPRAWIALLHGRVRASLAATTGVEDAIDVVTYLLAGADVVMTASALLRHGPGHVAVLLDGLAAWMARKGFTTVDDIRRLVRTTAEQGQNGHGRSSYLTAMRETTGRYSPR
jgi:dihydroorotate dehydrogenase (fumarate)